MKFSSIFFLFKKELSRIHKSGLPCSPYSRALSHYHTMRELLPAASPPWAGSFLLRRPGDIQLPRFHHIDTMLSTDARSAQGTTGQNSQTRLLLQLKPPVSWITGTRHCSRRKGLLSQIPYTLSIKNYMVISITMQTSEVIYYEFR